MSHRMDHAHITVAVEHITDDLDLHPTYLRGIISSSQREEYLTNKRVIFNIHNQQFYLYCLKFSNFEIRECV